MTGASDLGSRKVWQLRMLHMRFYQIGTPAGLARTDAYLRKAQRRGQ
jgi:hypothetical protein